MKESTEPVLWKIQINFKIFHKDFVFLYTIIGKSERIDFVRKLDKKPKLENLTDNVRPW